MVDNDDDDIPVYILYFFGRSKLRKEMSLGWVKQMINVSCFVYLVFLKLSQIFLPRLRSATNLLRDENIEMFLCKRKREWKN
jgi:hypothetical protein